jgi:hypothetical protein
MWHAAGDDERCGLPPFYYVKDTHLSCNGGGVPFVCILIVDEALVSPGAAATGNWIPDP